MLDLNNKTKFRLIRSGTLSAQENMVIDRILFESFSQTKVPVFRVYSWKKSFTFGISDEITKLKEKEELIPYQENYAKRMTGGGILFHGHDISYSLSIPSSCMQGLSVKESYEKICQFLLRFYANLGLNPSYAKDDTTVYKSKNVFCQLGFEDYDILIDGKKMGGNAQRRTKESIFQHGSIGLVALDENLHTGNSLEDVGITLSMQEATRQLIHSFETTFNVVLEDSILTNEEKEQLEAVKAKEA